MFTRKFNVINRGYDIIRHLTLFSQGIVNLPHYQKSEAYYFTNSARQSKSTEEMASRFYKEMYGSKCKISYCGYLKKSNSDN